MPDFRFTPGLLATPQRWSLEDGRLTGPDGVVTLSEVRTATFDYTLHKNRALMKLGLETDGERLVVSCNGVLGGSDRVQFLRLAHGVMVGLPPEAQIRSPGAGVLMWGFTGLGVLMGLFGLYFAGMAWWDGFTVGIGMGAGMILLGVFLAWSVSPWEGNQPKTPTEGREWMERLLAL